MLALIPLFPLIGFLINGAWYAFFKRAWQEKKAHAGHGVIATTCDFRFFQRGSSSLIQFFQLMGWRASIASSSRRFLPIG